MRNDTGTNTKKLFVGNLPFSITREQLTDLFSPHGEIVEINLITDRYSGQSKGFAFVEFATEEQANTAIKAVNDTEIDGRKIVVNVSRPQKPREDRGGSRQNRY